MKKDTILISTVVGLSATAIETIITFIMKITGLIKTPLYIYVGKLSIGEVPHKPWMEAAIGIPGHLITGVIFTFVFVLILQKWGDDYLYLKGLGFGGFLWLIHEVIIPNMITTNIILKLSPSSQIWHIITAFIWGLAAAFLYRLVRNRIKTV